MYFPCFSFPPKLLSILIKSPSTLPLGVALDPPDFISLFSTRRYTKWSSPREHCLWRYIAYKHGRRRTNIFQARTLVVVPRASSSDLNGVYVCTRLSAFRQTFSSALRRSSSLSTLCRYKVVFSRLNNPHLTRRACISVSG